jgi:nucleotide-binding universal stress UspA family protein
MCAVATSTAIALKNILVATDLSPASLWSLPYVVGIAHQYGSTIYLATVVPMAIYGVARPESFDAIEAECHDYAQEKLDRFSAGIRAQGIEVQVLLTEGDVARVIPDWVEQHKIGLLAVGTTGRGGLHKLFLGSTAEELIREVSCPVLTVGPALSGESPARLRSVLFATDFSAESLRAGQYACSIASRYNARLILMHVTDEHATQVSRRSLIRRLQDLIPENLNLPNEPEELLAQGRPAGKILEVANQHGVDLIAIGVRGAGGLARAASHFGSTAHEVIVGATCPVLVVRAPNSHRTPVK